MEVVRVILKKINELGETLGQERNESDFSFLAI